MHWFRLFRVALVTAYLYLLLEAGNLLLWPWPSRRESFRSFILRSWGRGLCGALGVRVKRRGTPPREPFLLVANHLTYLDILVLGGQIGGAFVAKSEIRGWPIMGRLCRASGIIFVDRSSKRGLVGVARQVEQIFALGRGVTLFPEATTSRGESLLPFRSALLEVAVRNGQPVHHAVVSYRTAPSAPPPDEVVCWWGGVPFGPHFRRLLRLPRIDALITFGAEPIQEPDRKRLAERLRAAMEKNFVPSAAAVGEATRSRVGET